MYKSVDVKTYLPEPHDLFGVPLVMPVYSIPLPVIHIHFLHTTQHQLLKKIFQLLATPPISAYVFKPRIQIIYQISLSHYIFTTRFPNIFRIFSEPNKPESTNGVRQWGDKHVHTSSSLSSKYWSHCRGTTSLKPSRKAFDCSSTPLENLQLVIKL